MLTILRQPRYLWLSALMVLLALICSAAGTWQVFRFEQKHRANHQLRSDAHDQAAPVATALGPASAATSNGQAQKFRVVTATGTYLETKQTLLRGQTQGDDIGYLVITPLRTDNGVLLIARGFITQNNAADTSPKAVPAPPTGTVNVSARLEPADTTQDKFGRLPGDQVDTVNPTQQSSRLGEPVWNAYAELLPGQPGGAGLQAIPAPDLSNPAGGAEEPQHLAYVLQWYLFALLALAAPFILARAELHRDDDDEEDEEAAPAKPLSRRERKASLDDRLAGRA